ncbi:Vegetative incompatibility protein HET-E-1 [Penicillium macrosclerotiorum]|uniref:Vegetative incompatibility protein HET-E-1 n=1 Tax=Penicillium macrosclerotiorum TaxID=303699 RepID=UPI002549BCD6|nr:Vegetative incompatibility protein HET-E-1 [Penicillium macrosclerotiorum]KAJ5683401.1 Vegetative incompatibility protein HET-E-1 [Penicillium macrosclerotiorum]
MMDGVGTASSIAAVIDLSAKVGSLLFQFTKAVKNARSDVSRLMQELDRLKNTLHGAQAILDSPKGAWLRNSQALYPALNDCSSQLLDLQYRLETKLGVGPLKRSMSRFGLRSLKWPLESKDVNKAVKALEHYRDTLTTALTIDQTGYVLSISQHTILSKLPFVKEAVFDSHADEQHAQCHPETRVSLLQKIEQWADDPEAECVFWLNGRAGTGKSTISRTVAQSFSSKGSLGGSFFFKRGERDRDNPAQLFTSIASQLISRVPLLAADVGASMEADPAIVCKALRLQFEELILEPLRKLNPAAYHGRSIVLVIDALDECEGDHNIRAILGSLSRGGQSPYIPLKAFVTSRPELPVRLGFNDIKGSYQNIILHDIPKPIVQGDIATYLNYELAKIKSDYNSQSSNLYLPFDWPGPEITQTLVHMSVPLFIIAATIVRFIRDPAWSDPAGQLKKVIEHTKSQPSELNTLDATYGPILDRLLLGQSEMAKRSLVREFQEIVGTIVLLAEPLSATSLARLLNVPRSDIDRRLLSLHSVLDIPESTDHPVRLFHLSFRDFLLDSDKLHGSRFSISEEETHGKIAMKCLNLLSSHLQEDICDLKMPGTQIVNIPIPLINSCISADIRYACLHWVYHIVEGKMHLTDTHPVYAFLKKHFLHWLEVLSLLRKASDSIAMMRNLQDLLTQDSPLFAFLHDAVLFILNCRSIISTAPLQIYASALPFAPKNSLIRRTFENSMPSWIPRLPKVDFMWNDCLQILQGHTAPVMSVAFSRDGKAVASASSDRTVRIWDSTTGEEIQKLGHFGRIHGVAFSPAGKTIATISSESVIRFWDINTGDEQQVLEGHTDIIAAISFSPDGKSIASSSHDHTVRLWDGEQGETSLVLQHGDLVTSVAFSTDGERIISASQAILYVWNLATGEEEYRLEGHSDSINAVTFRNDGRTIASASSDRTIRIWDTETGDQIQQLGHESRVHGVAFSPNGKTIASASFDSTIRLWDAATGTVVRMLNGHSGLITAISFSPDGNIVASASSDETVRIWDVMTDRLPHDPPNANDQLDHPNQTDRPLNSAPIIEGRSKQRTCTVNSVIFSPDATIVAASYSNGMIRLWDAQSNEEMHTIEAHGSFTTAIAFSWNSQVLASGSMNGLIRIWNPKTGKERQKFYGHLNSVNSLAFSPINMALVSTSNDSTVRLWSVLEGERDLLYNDLGHRSKAIAYTYGHPYKAIAFSSDGGSIVAASANDTVWLSRTIPGRGIQVTPCYDTPILAVAASTDARIVASTSADMIIRLWDTVAGSQVYSLYTAVTLTRLSFSVDNLYLNTDRGQIILSIDIDDEPSIGKLTGPSILLCKDWVIQGSDSMLWVPLDYRPVCVDFQNNTFALGDASGGMRFMEIDFNR